MYKLKLCQNKKGKRLLFCRVPQIFLGPSYFEMALVVLVERGQIQHSASTYDSKY